MNEKLYLNGGVNLNVWEQGGKIVAHMARGCGKTRLSAHESWNFPFGFTQKFVINIKRFHSSRHVFIYLDFLSVVEAIQWLDGVQLMAQLTHAYWKKRNESFSFSLQLRREQELQQQKLWRDFQEQKKELELQHKMQIESKLQVSFPSLYSQISGTCYQMFVSLLKKFSQKHFLGKQSEVSRALFYWINENFWLWYSREMIHGRGCERFFWFLVVFVLFFSFCFRFCHPHYFLCYPHEFNS